MVGSQKGSINLHYQMPKGEIANSREDMTFVTQFEEGSNMKLQCFGPGRHDNEKRAGLVLHRLPQTLQTYERILQCEERQRRCSTLHHRYLSDKKLCRRPRIIC